MTITAITVSLEVADKDYGNGKGRFMSLSAKVNEGEPGIPITEPYEAVEYGLSLYQTAFETLFQGRYADAGMSGPEYKTAQAAASIRFSKVGTLYRKLKDMDMIQLDELLKSTVKETK